MGQKLVVGPFNKGLRTDTQPFTIDNDNFPTIYNAYQWRGQVKRKRGTTKLGQLQRFLGKTDAGTGNFSTTITPFPESGDASFVVGDTVFTDPGTGLPADLLVNSAGTGTAHLTDTGVLTITGSELDKSVIYIPHLPVMGIEENILNPQENAQTVAFDTTWAYNIATANPYTITDVSYFKNPPSSGGYTAKSSTNLTPLWWNGQDYQQFWTVNYAGALWATNGVTVPFDITNIGMQFNTITAIAGIVAGPPASATITTGTNHGLEIGDFVFINEVDGVTGINFQTGYVTAVPAVNQITVEFPNATLNGAWSSGGIVQYLTNRIDDTLDCIRWYDGQPSDGVIPPSFNTGLGWVNYCPPLSQNSYALADLPQGIYYLVGCKMIVPFKDRLLFLGPVVQTSSAGSQVYLQDTIIFTENGTPYYTASYTNTPDPNIDTPTSVTNEFNALLVPVNQTAISPALFADQIGFGGWISAGVNDFIISQGKNEDSLIIGFTRFQARVISTGSSFTPFEFFIVNSEYGTTSTFSTVTMDQGVLARGDRGFTITSQTSSARFDLDVIDQVFQINLLNNGNERFTAVRDFQNEWVYFTYNDDEIGWRYPNQTLFYNYRDKSFALFNESYTTYGIFKESTGKTWADLTDFTWAEWTTPWNFGDNNILQPIILGGNQQGYIMVRETQTTDEDPSLAIANINNGSVTSNNHNLNNGDFIFIKNASGTIGSLVNNQIFKVANATDNSFDLTPNPGSGTYLGSGEIVRMYVPFIQTKQFPISWEMGRKTRIGVQQYLLTATANAQITVQMYLSQNAANAFNAPPIVPSTFPSNSGLIYNQTVYTCPESTNLGLTPFNNNMLMLTQPGNSANTSPINNQEQIWHRVNTSLIGDTVQLGFTLSEEQMSDPAFRNQFAEIELHGFILELNPSQMLS